MPAPKTVQEGHIPAPVGGLNTVSAGTAMPPGDAVQLYNLIPAEYGLRSRLGSREWHTGLTGSAGNQVRSIFYYHGSVSDGSDDRIFATTNTGIWDVSDSAAIPEWQAWEIGFDYELGAFVLTSNGQIYECVDPGISASEPTGTGTGIVDGGVLWDYVMEFPRVLEFATPSGDAGRGVFHAFATTGGHFLAYTDEVNGYHLYTESTDTWVAVAAGVTQAWEANTAYLAGNQVTNDGNVYICDQSGTSAGSGGPTGTGTNITDNSARWDYVSAVVSPAIGLSLADQNLGLEVDPANFVFVASWKHRLMFAEKDTGHVWYLGLASIAGTATRLDLEFSAKPRHGGDLVGVYNWTLDGGAGIDDHLVFVFRGGDIAIYQGTDPDSAETFALKGVWFAGAIPKGRHVVTPYGGDLLILTKNGAVPLSKIVSGGQGLGQYVTGKISNLFNTLMLAKSGIHGWSMHIHPEDNSLLVLHPTTDGANTQQLAMSLANGAWSRYRDLPMYSAAAGGGKLWFGSADGKIYVNDGYVDGVTLEDPNSYRAVEWEVLTAFQNLGSPRKKRVEMIRPVILAQNDSPEFSAVARYDFDMRSADDVTGGTTGEDEWGGATWGESTWAGSYTASRDVRGAVGMGTDLAIGIKGTATSRTVLVGIDVVFSPGGFL